MGWSILSLTLIACGQEDTLSQSQIPFSVISVIQGNTRMPQLDTTGAGAFVNDDINTLFFQNGNGELEQTFNYQYGKTYYWYELELPQSVEGLKVSACYPPVDTENPKYYQWDVTNSQLPTSDFLAAQATVLQQNAASQVNLKFKHLMHLFKVKLEADETSVIPSTLDTAILTLSHWKPTAILNLFTAEVQKVTGAPSQQSQTGHQGLFILPPQETGDIQLKVQIGHRTSTFNLSDIRIENKPISQLESGKTLTLTIKVSKETFCITGQDISGWENQGEANGEIIL